MDQRPARPASSPTTWLLVACGALLACLTAAQLTLSGEEDIVTREAGTIGVVATALVALAACGFTIMSRAGGRWVAWLLAVAAVGMLLVPAVYWWTRDTSFPGTADLWRGPSYYWMWLTATPLTVEGMAALLVAGPALVVAAVLLLREHRMVPTVPVDSESGPVRAR